MWRSGGGIEMDEWTFFWKQNPALHCICDRLVECDSVNSWKRCQLMSIHSPVKHRIYPSMNLLIIIPDRLVGS